MQTINNWQNSYSEPRYTYYRRWLNAYNASDKQIKLWAHAWAKNKFREKTYNTLCKTSKGRQAIENSYLEAMCDQEFGKGNYPPLAKTPALNAASLSAGSMVIAPYFPAISSATSAIDVASDVVSFLAEPSKNNLKAIGWDSFGPIVDKTTDFIPGELDDAIADPISKTASHISQIDDAKSAKSSIELLPYKYPKSLLSPLNWGLNSIYKRMFK